MQCLNVLKYMNKIFSTSVLYSSLNVNTKGIVFYAVPHKGSDIASMVTGKARYVFLPSFEVKALQKGNNILTPLPDASPSLMSSLVPSLCTSLMRLLNVPPPLMHSPV